MVSLEDAAETQVVCSVCVGDYIVRKEIEDQGSNQEACSFCGQSGAAIALERLAARIHEVYQQIVGLADEQRRFSDDSDNPEYVESGRTPSELISEMLNCEEELADALVEYLSLNFDGNSWEEEVSYDSACSRYEIRPHSDGDVTGSWLSFRVSIRHESRFFNEAAKRILDKIIGAAIRGEHPNVRSPVRVIGGPENPVEIYRARVAHDDETRKRIYAAPVQELAPPPRNCRRPGRMNPAGVAIFYAALDKETCVAEVRVPVGGAAIVGKFELLRPLRVFDMRVLDEANGVDSYFRPDLAYFVGYLGFLQNFHRLISAPIMPGTEELDYLPTQFVAEYLAKVMEPPIEGIIYRSALTSPPTYNIAIFADACIVEGRHDRPVSTPDRVRINRSSFSEDEDDDYEGVWVSILRTTESDSKTAQPSVSDVADFSSHLQFRSAIDAPEDFGKEPVLRLTKGCVETIRVKTIQYETSADQVEYVDDSDLEWSIF